MSRSLDRRAFLKGIAVIAAAAPAAALLPNPGRAQDPAAADSTAADSTAKAPGPAPAAAATVPPTYGPDFSICRNAEERALLERQYASTLELVQTIRKAPLPSGVEPVTAFAALARTRVKSATAPEPVPTPATPSPEEER